MKVQERIFSTLEQMQVPSGTGPDVQRSKRPLLASCNRCKCPMVIGQMKQPFPSGEVS